jgi:hypothetical protein
MKAKFAVLALIALSSVANAKEMFMNSVKSERTFNELVRTANVIEKSAFRMQIQQGDVICTRYLVLKAESAVPYRYACTYWVEDSYAPAYESDTRARSNKRVQ